jgi:hypothetical protein
MGVSWRVREAKVRDGAGDPAAPRRGMNLEVSDV